MDQQKIGAFLKELRKEKGITQEQLADQLYVSRRTVSRWETGSNMPDLDVLVELADLYDVDLRDIFNGQRREPEMDKEVKDTLMQAADYTQELRKKITKRFNFMFIGGIAALAIYIVTLYIVPEDAGGIIGFIQGIMLGISFGMLIVGFLMTSPLGEKLMNGKRCLMGRIAKQ